MSHQKVAIVTGAGSGIGKAAALGLLGEGYAVALAGRREELLEAAAAESGAGERALPVRTDIRDPEAVAALFAATKARFGRLGTCSSTMPASAPEGCWKTSTSTGGARVVDTNLTGSFLCTQEAFRIMKDQTPGGGRIINNGSISAQVPRPNSAAYTSTKHALTGLTKSTALDGRKYDIACGQIDIGNALTTMTGRMQRGVPQANDSVVAEPTMDIDNVTQAVLYMASLPLDANVLFLTVMATKMPFVGRG